MLNRMALLLGTTFLLLANTAHAAPLLKTGIRVSPATPPIQSARMNSGFSVMSARVVILTGQVSCLTQGNAVELHTGDCIPDGAEIFTGPRAHCYIKWPRVSLLVLQNTLVATTPNSHEVSLRKGTVHVILSRLNKLAYRLSTPGKSAIVDSHCSCQATAYGGFERITVERGPD